MANDREDTVGQKTFWTVCTALAFLALGSFGHSQFLDREQTQEKREWRSGFKSDVASSMTALKESVKELKEEQREQAKDIRSDTKEIQNSLNRLLLTGKPR